MIYIKLAFLFVLLIGIQNIDIRENMINILSCLVGHLSKGVTAVTIGVHNIILYPNNIQLTSSFIF